MEAAAEAYVASTYASAAVSPQTKSPESSRPASSDWILVDSSDLPPTLEQEYADAAKEAVSRAVDGAVLSVAAKDMTEAQDTRISGNSVLDSIAPPALDVGAEETLLLQRVEEMVHKNAARRILASQEETHTLSPGSPGVVSRSPSGGSRELMPPPTFPHIDEKNPKKNEFSAAKENPPPMLAGIGKRLLLEPPVNFLKN